MKNTDARCFAPGWMESLAKQNRPSFGAVCFCLMRSQHTLFLHYVKEIGCDVVPALGAKGFIFWNEVTIDWVQR